MKTFKTPKGTELPIMDIKGKDYLQAAPRIVWFREEKPEWSIETEFLVLTESTAVCRATIRNEGGRVIAQATSMETKQGFESFVEKAETCAVSRAASFCNFGTLMAQELEDQGKLAESPATPRQAPINTPQSFKEEFRGMSPQMGGVKVTEAQLRRLFALQKKAGMSDTQCKDVAASLGINKSRKELDRAEYDKLCAAVEAWAPN